MGCIGFLVGTTFKLAGFAALAVGALLVVSGFRIRRPRLCQAGAVCAVVPLLLGPRVLALVVLGAGLYGAQRFKALPR